MRHTRPLSKWLNLLHLQQRAKRSPPNGVNTVHPIARKLKQLQRSSHVKLFNFESILENNMIKNSNSTLARFVSFLRKVCPARPKKWQESQSKGTILTSSIYKLNLTDRVAIGALQLPPRFECAQIKLSHGVPFQSVVQPLNVAICELSWHL